jgi:hypothetical protein
MFPISKNGKLRILAGATPQARFLSTERASAQQELVLACHDKILLLCFSTFCRVSQHEARKAIKMVRRHATVLLTDMKGLYLRLHQRVVMLFRGSRILVSFSKGDSAEQEASTFI